MHGADLALSCRVLHKWLVSVLGHIIRSRFRHRFSTRAVCAGSLCSGSCIVCSSAATVAATVAVTNTLTWCHLLAEISERRLGILVGARSSWTVAESGAGSCAAERHRKAHQWAQSDGVRRPGGSRQCVQPVCTASVLGQCVQPVCWKSDAESSTVKDNNSLDRTLREPAAHLE